MKRRHFLLVLGSAGCSRDRRPRLNVFNWSNYAAPDTIRRFEAEFGVRVRYGIYESNEEMLARVMSGNSGWDMVFPSNSLIRPMRELNLLAPLRLDRLTNAGHLDAAFRAPLWDPKLEWSIPFMWGGTGIAYNRSLAPAPRAWSDLWDPRLKGRITMLDDPADVIAACLKKLGYSINTENPKQLLEAREQAFAIKPLLRAYVNAEVRDQLVAGDVLAAQMWSTIAQQAIDASPQLRFIFPREGFLLYMDCAVILRESKRQELAHRFLDYLLRPDVSAQIGGYCRTATANAGARLLLPEADRSNRTSTPMPRPWRAGNGHPALPPRRRSCVTGCGRRSSRRNL